MSLINYFAVKSRHPAHSFHHYLMALLLASLCAIGSVQALAQGAQPEPAVATVNINKADAATLAASLNGVGNSRALAIVRYREEFGPFTTVEQLAEVKGIGASTVDRNRAVITLE